MSDPTQTAAERLIDEPIVRACGACGEGLAEGESHWSIFLGPAGGFACPKLVNEAQAAVEARVDAIMAEVRAETLRAFGLHAPMHSPHEGHSVIREELQELWKRVRHDKGRDAKARHEAVQVAAMGIRYVFDLAPGEDRDD